MLKLVIISVQWTSLSLLAVVYASCSDPSASCLCWFIVNILFCCTLVLLASCNCMENVFLSFFANFLPEATTVKMLTLMTVLSVWMCAQKEEKTTDIGCGQALALSTSVILFNEGTGHIHYRQTLGVGVGQVCYKLYTCTPCTLVSIEWQAVPCNVPNNTRELTNSMTLTILH